MSNVFMIPKGTIAYVREDDPPIYSHQYYRFIEELPTLPVKIDIIPKITYSIPADPWNATEIVSYKLVAEREVDYIECTYLNSIKSPEHPSLWPIKSWYVPLKNVIVVATCEVII